MKTFKEYENIDKKCEEVIFEHELEGIQEAEYQGRTVKLNKIMQGDAKKFTTIKPTLNIKAINRNNIIEK